MCVLGTFYNPGACWMMKEQKQKKILKNLEVYNNP